MIGRLGPDSPLLFGELMIAFGVEAIVDTFSKPDVREAYQAVILEIEGAPPDKRNQIPVPKSLFVAVARSEYCPIEFLEEDRGIIHSILKQMSIDERFSEASPNRGKQFRRISAVEAILKYGTEKCFDAAHRGSSFPDM